MNPETTILRIITFALFALLTALIYQRAKQNPKRKILLTAFAFLTVYSMMMLTGEGLLDYLGHIFKISGYALLLGVFTYIARPLREPKQAGIIALATGLIYVGLLVAEKLTAVSGVSPLCVIIASAFLLLSAYAYSRLPDRAAAKVFMVSGFVFVSLAYVRHVLFPNAPMSPIVCMATGVIFLVAGALTFYASLDQPEKEVITKQAPSARSRPTRPASKPHRQQR